MTPLAEGNIAFFVASLTVGLLLGLVSSLINRR